MAYKLQKPEFKTRHVLKQFLICCEGKKTETGYLEYIQGKLPESIKGRIKLYIVGTGRSTKALLAEVKKVGERIESSNYYVKLDETWIVFDRDNHTCFDETILECRQSNGEFNAAWSNPCFELWILLHFIDFAKPVQPNKEGREALVKKLTETIRKLVGENFTYDKGNFRNVELALENHGSIQNAVKRAENLSIRHKGVNPKPSGQNPGTNVHKLIHSLFESIPTP